MSSTNEKEELMIRRLTKLFSLLVLVSAYFIWTPSSAGACSCGPPRPLNVAVKEQLRTARAVFSGKVINVTEEEETTGTRVVYLFEVQSIWKGPTNSHIEVYNFKAASMCEFPFKLNESYLVYAYKVEAGSRFYAGLSACGATTQLSHAGDQIAVLGQGRLPTDIPGMPRSGKADESIWLLTVIASAGAIGVGSFMTNKTSK